MDGILHYARDNNSFDLLLKKQLEENDKLNTFLKQKLSEVKSK
jgi:hypothetical protein